MVRSILVCGLVAGLWSNKALQAGAISFDRQNTSARTLQHCDPACELQSQDKAFSLLMEIYRQHRAYKIQTQYEARLSVASGIGEKNDTLLIAADGKGVRALRGFILRLAEEERELSLQQLQQQVEYMQVAYSCARRSDETEIGQTVPSQVNTEKAAAKLKDYVIVALRTPNDDLVRTIEPVPATSVLLDASPVPPSEHPAIAPCE